MDLWIRTQSKLGLYLIKDNLHIEKRGNSYYICSKEKNYEYSYEFLAKYDTLERAFDILDEIQDILFKKPITFTQFPNIKCNYDNNGNLVPVQNNNDCTIQQFNTYVYEMPEK